MILRMVFFSSRPRERIFEIMKDSRVGAMGAATIVFALLVKFVCFSQIDPSVFVKAAVLSPLAGRCSLLMGIVLLPPANPEAKGSGAMFMKECRWWEFFISLFVLVLCGFALLGWAGIIMSCVAVLAVLLFSFQCYRRIGGATGDTLGATCEIVEMVVLITATANGFAGLARGAWL